MNDSEAILKQLKEMQERMGTLERGTPAPGTAGFVGGTWAPGTSSAAGGAWGNSTPSVAPIGMLVPVEIETPIGIVSTYLQFPAQAAGRIVETLEEVSRSGFKLRAFQPRQQGNWGGGGGGRGGFGGGGGGGWRR